MRTFMEPSRLARPLPARALDRWLALLRAFATVPWLAWPLVVGNLAAVWYGWTDYYAAQLAATPKPLWPFVPDSPNAVLLFAAAVALRQFRLRWHLLDLLAWFQNIKIGLWTVFVLLYYFDAFFADEPVLRWTLLWLHVGMVGQAFVLHRDLRIRPLPGWSLAAVAALAVLGDWLDYGPLDLHPYLRSPRHHDPIVTVVTVGLTVVILAWAYAWYRPGRARRGAAST